MRVRRGAVSTTDGPYAETKEHLAGFYLVECRCNDPVFTGNPACSIPAYSLRAGRELGGTGGRRLVVPDGAW